VSSIVRFIVALAHNCRHGGSNDAKQFVVVARIVHESASVRVEI
jgi:hypothetical protein